VQQHNYNRFITPARVTNPDLAALPTRTASDVPLTAYFHNDDDLKRIKAYAKSVILDVAVDHLPFFAKNFHRGSLDPEVAHPEMSEKIMTIMLPMLFHSENNYGDLKLIMDDDVVSFFMLVQKRKKWNTGVSPFFFVFFFFSLQENMRKWGLKKETILTVGDQLTCERISGFIRLMGCDTPEYLKFVPSVADWHARLNFVMVRFFFIFFFSKKKKKKRKKKKEKRTHLHVLCSFVLNRRFGRPSFLLGRTERDR